MGVLMVLRRQQVPKLYGGDAATQQIQEPNDRAIEELQRAPIHRQQVFFPADAAAATVPAAPLFRAGGQVIRVERIVLHFDAALAANGTNFKELAILLGTSRVLYRLSNEKQALDPARDYDAKIAPFNISGGDTITQARTATAAGAIFPASGFTIYYREH